MTIGPDVLASDAKRERKLNAAWNEEFRRRIDDIESGHIQMLDADEMDAELLAELAETDHS
jgi:putative addiction module component (TIGR02574 family)